MKKIFYSVVLILIASVKIFPQIDVSAGMGLSFFSSPSFTDYINVFFAAPGEDLQTFNSSVEFFIEGDYDISEKYQVGFEYAWQKYSYNATTSKSGYYDLSLGHHKPSVMFYYIMRGTGYKLKFGGGAGPRFLLFDEQKANSPEPEDYSAIGLGLVLRAQGNTMLGDNFYANIGADIRYDMPGEPDSDGKKMFNSTLDENVNFNSVSLGIRLGISYFF